MKSDLNKYLKLKTALVNEKAKLEARLGEISKVLGGDSVGAAPSATAPTTTTKGKRTFSAATRAKMKASQQARWAKLKGKVAPTSATPSAPTAKKKRKMSAAGRAAIKAAQKARWAKVKAAKAKAEK